MRFKKPLTHSVYIVGSLESENFEIKTIVGYCYSTNGLYIKYTNVVGETTIIKWKSFQKWVYRKSAKWVGFYDSKKKIFVTLTRIAKLKERK